MIDLSEKQYFIFDLDGTLLDLEELNYESFQETIKNEIGRDFSYEEYMRYMAGVGSVDGFHSYFKSIGYDDEAAEKAVKAYRKRKHSYLENHFNEVVKIQDGAIDFLKKLQADNRRIGLGTSTAKHFARMLLERADMSKYFQIIVTVDDVQRSKPAPDIFLEAFKLLGGTDKSEAIIFEDTENGVQGAINAGIEYVVFHNPGKNDDVVEKAEKVINSYNELIKFG